MAFKDGPYLSGFAICQAVTHDDDGTPTLHGVFSGVVLDLPDLGPSRSFMSAVGLVIFIGFLAGRFAGNRRVALTLLHPGGKEQQGFAKSWLFIPDESSSDAVETTIVVTAPGVHWFRLWLDRKVIAEIPLLAYLPEADRQTRLHA